jgi:regulator of sigma E protease
MITTLIFLIILGLLVFVHELGHFLFAKKSGVKVEEFGIGFPPKLFSYKPKNDETLYSLNLIPFGGFVKIFGEDGEEVSNLAVDSERSFVNKPKYIQILILVAGVSFNVIFGWILLISGFYIGLPTVITEENSKYATQLELSIVEILADSPADKADLRVGDNIIYLETNGIKIDKPSAEKAREIISQSTGDININYKRGDEILNSKVRAVDGLIENGVAIGVGMENTGIVSYPLLKSIKEGTITTLILIKAIVLGFVTLIMNAFIGEANLNSVTGPVGIFSMVGNAAEMGFVYLISFTAIISLHLAVLNLVPFPALDGGRILFVLIEWIKGSSINPKIQNNLNGLGFALLIIFMLFITYKDILKLF